MTICLLLGVKSNEDDDTEGSSSPVKLLCPLKLLGLPSPGGLTGAYHYTNMQRLELELTKANIIDPNSKNCPTPIRMNIEVDGVSSGRLGMAELPHVTTLNTTRLKEDLRLHLEKRWHQDGGDPDLLTTATRRPEVFKALSRRAAYKHIKLFIYPVWVNDKIITMGTYYGDPAAVSYSPHI
jgi:hypothetical protein